MSAEENSNKSENDGIGKDFKTYIENRLQLFIIDISEHVAYAFADGVRRFIGFTLIAAGILFVWLALAFYIGDLVGNTSLGFLISAVPLLILGLFFSKVESRMLVKKIQAEMVSSLLINFDDSDSKKSENKQSGERIE